MKEIKFKNIFKFLIALSCAGLIILYFRNHLEDFQRIKQIKLTDALGLLGALFFVQVVHSYKIFLVVRMLGLQNISFLRWFYLVTISRFVNQHFFQGGNIYRFIQLKKEYQFSYFNSLGAILIFLWLEVINLLGFTILIILLFQGVLPDDYFEIFTYILLVFFLVCLFPTCFFKFATCFKTDFYKKLNVNINRFENLKIEFYKLIKASFLLRYFFITSLFIFLYIIAIKIAFGGIGVSLELFQNLFYTLTIILSRMFNIVPANIGVSEVICGTIPNAVNISFGNGVIVASMIRVINYFIYASVTFISFSQKKLIHKNKV